MKKVFCIGFHKTGTTSLGEALSILGYRVAAQFGVHDEDIEKSVLERSMLIANRFDAFEDNPWPLLYREMDEAFPNSKFILTLRDPEVWYSSVLRHFGDKETPMRRWIYGRGSPLGHKNRYIAKYKKHNAQVAKYFKNRRSDLLILRFERGHGWTELCGFLGVSQPSVAFPHSNSSEQRESGSK